MKSHSDRAFIGVKENSSQDEEVRIINVFQTYSLSMASYDKASQGRNTTSLSFHSPLIIPRVPVTFAKIKCGRKIGIKCFSRFLLVAHGRKPSKPHFNGPIRR